MYLVELKPGKEELYRTGDDLALAIRDGAVDARSRIYHRATAKWISITLHPQYKAIIADQQDEAARPARKWYLLPNLTGSGQDTLSTEEAPAQGDSVSWKSPLGLGFTSILLVLGIQLAFSGPRPPWASKSTPAVAWTEESEPVEQEPTDDYLSDETDGVISLASTTVSAPVTEAPVLPRAPRLKRKALRALLAPRAASAKVKANSVQDLLARYQSASDSVLAKLEAGMRVARLNRLFATSRLSPGGGVTDTRLSLAGAVNIIRIFRQDQAALEQAFQDSVTRLARTNRWRPRDVRQWYSRSPRAEPAALELASSGLIASIDSILGVLGSQAGAYKLRGTAIAFEDPGAGLAYGALRRKIREQIDAIIAAGGSTSSGPAGLLLRAIGTTALPRET